MVTVTGYQERKSEDGRVFFALTLTSGIELIKSQSGAFYATAKRASIPSTFNEQTCKTLIGEEFKGSIKSMPCEDYIYVIPETGENIVLNQRNEYFPDEEVVTNILPSALSNGMEMAN